MSKRFVITLPDAVHSQLVDWAEQRGQPPATLASFLVQQDIRQAIDAGEFAPSKTKGKQQQPKAS